jgi:hypothetical protein
MGTLNKPLPWRVLYGMAGRSASLWVEGRKTRPDAAIAAQDVRGEERGQGDVPFRQTRSTGLPSAAA